jgi:hypothetical protein
VLPRPGTSIDDIGARLRQLIDTVYQAAEPVDYAIWVTAAETNLRESFIDVRLSDSLASASGA